MSAAELPAHWLAQLHAHASRPPAAPRLALRWRGVEIGSVEPDVLRALHAAAPGTRALLCAAGGAAQLADGDPADGDLTPLLGQLAGAMRAAGLAHAWRDEQLAVRDAQARVLGTIERAAVRPLGIATHAVHLVGRTPDGGHWVQQRSWDKATDPGRWDTLMGGMVPARDSLAQALERETWEEAGLRLDQLQGLAHGGQVTSRGPSAEVRWGYVIETIDWFACVVPEGVTPRNQDGEVQEFRLVPPSRLYRDLVAGAYTTEAALVFAAHVRNTALPPL